MNRGPTAKRIPRRTVLRAAGVSMALPALEMMLPMRLGGRGRAQSAPPTGPKQRFFGFFYPNGTDPRFWNPRPGPLEGGELPVCLQDLSGFATEGIWPAGNAVLSDVTLVTGIDHSGVCVDIHMPSMSLSAHRGVANTYTPPEPTLDQFLAERLQGDTPYRNLSLSATDDLDIGQGHLSFRAGGQVETVIRSPQRLFEMLFGDGFSRPADRRHRVLDLVLEDARRLRARAGAADRQRLEQYFDAVSELEGQLGASTGAGCTVVDAPERGGDWHATSKAFIDLGVLAMACDLTNVVVVQYSNSWGVHYGDYSLGSGRQALRSWSDHFISHKLDDNDRATDLDGLPRAEAQQIADARVVMTSRFKVRRFAYLVEALKNVSTPTGTLYDETLAMYFSENGDGDSHARTNMPILLAGGVGGFETGRSVSAAGKPTGALHASIIQRYGIEVGEYGNPAGRAIAGL
ncbi:MAG: DUF1552 domain-containing protein [Myxococcales bacterium]|nr:DUF1552 domain-containing protein [Myxococcales bacterium]MDD9964641.1 DUF1552 domain-containing protein [Myxococcales bacterium]